MVQKNVLSIRIGQKIKMSMLKYLNRLVYLNKGDFVIFRYGHRVNVDKEELDGKW